jgi:hypothetical protein
MPVFIAAIAGALIQITGSLVGRVLLALGLSVVTYTGVSTSLDNLKNAALQNATALPPDLLAIMSYMKVGESISIVVGAVVARAIINGVQNDSVKKWVLK